MAGRLNLHEELCEILNSTNAYYNPPASVNMKYPCIRYSPSEPHQRHANGKNYIKVNRYDGVVIDYDPESTIPDKLLAHFPMCKLGDPYVADNLNHFPFTIYY